MKTLHTLRILSTKLESRLLMAIVPFALLMASACQEDEPVAPSVIQFNVSQQNVTEGNEAIISLMLDKPAPSNVFVKVKIETNALYNEHFTTSPSPENGSIQIGIAKGNTSADFTINTLDNSRFDHGKYLILSLHSPSEGLRLGTGTLLVLTIDDDEGPSLANFAVNAGTLGETNKEGIVVHIALSSPAIETGSISITVSSDRPSDDLFIIDKEMVNHIIALPVFVNQVLLSFKILPVDNELYTGNHLVQFTISDVSGAVQKGNNLIYQLTLIDDELPSVVNFATNSGIINESDAEGIKVEIPFSSPARGTGSIKIFIDSQKAKYGSDYVTSPEAKNDTIKLDIQPGQTGAQFTVLPQRNFSATLNQQVSFTIVTTSGVAKKGTSLTYSLTIVNVDIEALVNFSPTSGTLDENNSGGITIDIPFTAQAPGEGEIAIQYSGTGAYYNNEFTTLPQPENGLIKLTVNAGDTGSSFKVFPKNDFNCSQQDRSIKFTIVFVNGSVKKGSDMEYILALKDDDAVATMGFLESSGSINESNSAGKVVKISFSVPASGSGYVTVSGPDGYNNQLYNVVYTTTPSMSSYSECDPGCDWYECYYGWCSTYSVYYLNLPVTAGTTSLEFLIKPVNNGDKDGNKTLDFVLTYSSSGCQQIGPDSKYTLTILDDD